MVEVIAEVGINHNGDFNLAKQLIQVALDADCDYVKFQKRTPELCVPEAQKSVERDTPWGRMTYLEYKKRIEFSSHVFQAFHYFYPGSRIFASVWDVPSAQLMASLKPPFLKIPSAKITDLELLDACNATGIPLIISTGMSTDREVETAVNRCYDNIACIMHAVSAYPCEDIDSNLAMIESLHCYGFPVGFSDHTRGLHMAAAAVAFGATMIEKHITLDRTMWGTDQSASIEPDGLKKYVRNLRAVAAGMGTGVKRVLPCEESARKKLRGE